MPECQAVRASVWTPPHRIAYRAAIELAATTQYCDSHQRYPPTAAHPKNVNPNQPSRCFTSPFLSPGSLRHHLTRYRRRQAARSAPQLLLMEWRAQPKSHKLGRADGRRGARRRGTSL